MFERAAMTSATRSDPPMGPPSDHPTFEAPVDVTIGSCTATYAVQALTPSQAGGTCVTDVDCDPFSDPANGRPLGSGINSDYAVACTKESWVTSYLTGDPDVGICFFTKPFPGLK